MPLRQSEITSYYADWINDLCSTDYDPALLTFMFRGMKFSLKEKNSVMKDDISRFYARIVTRFVRRPNKAAGLSMRPILLAAADFPVYKLQKSSLRDVQLNGGLHYHGIFLRPKISRFDGSLTALIRDNQKAFIAGTHIERIHVVPIIDAPDYVTRYALKSLGRGAAPDEEVLILPDIARRRYPTDRGYDEACRTPGGPSLLHPGRRRL